MDRLSFHAVAAAENLNSLWIGNRQKIISTCHTNDTAQRGVINAGGAQIQRIGREHRGDVGTGGMAGDERALRIAADVREQSAESGERLGTIFDKRREAEVRKESVMGDADANTGAGQCLTDDAVFASAAGNEASAVEEEHGRRGRLEAVGHIKIEALALLLAVRNVAFDSETGARHGQIEQRGWRAPAPEQSEDRGYKSQHFSRFFVPARTDDRPDSGGNSKRQQLCLGRSSILLSVEDSNRSRITWPKSVISR